MRFCKFGLIHSRPILQVKNWNRVRCQLLSFAAIVLSLIFAHNIAIAQVVNNQPDELKAIDVEEHLGGYIPLNLIFTNDTGQDVKLGEYFAHGRPVIAVLAYYTCPMLCTMVLNGLGDGIKNLNLVPGRDFEILTVSIDPTEPWDLAAAKKKNYVNYVGQPAVEQGWHFFVGHQSAIDSLAKSLGFKYFYDEQQKQYAHPAVIFVLSPKGEISRYLYGLEFKEKDLRFALLEAAQGKLGSTIDRILLYCYHYDPNSKGYVLFASNLMKLGGLGTVGLIIIFLGILWLKELRRPKQGLT